MEERYLQGRSSLLSVSIYGDLYELSNGNQILIYSSCDGDCEYGYYYFDGQTKRLIDGGEFDFDAGSSEEVLEEAMGWCSLDTKNIKYSLIDEEVYLDQLEEEGYSGF